MRRPALALLAAAATATLAGCGSRHWDGPREPPLQSALALAPSAADGLDSFQFTDVQATIRVTGTANPTRHGKFFLPDPSSLWKLSDIAWAADTGPTGQSPLVAIGLRSADNVSRVIRKLESCGYRARRLGAGVMYSASVAVMTRCAGPFGVDVPAQRQIGILPADEVILLADSSAELGSALRGEGDLRHDPAVRALLRPLAGSHSIVLVPEPSICSRLTRGALGNQPTPALVKAILRSDPAGPPSAGLGIGIRVTPGRTTGSIAVDYRTSRAAGAALPGLERRARLGYSFDSSAPFAALLHIDRARRLGPNAVLDVSGTHGTLPLYDMWSNFDLAFARC